jgi:hypothetical protein
MVVAPMMHYSPTPPNIIAEYIVSCQLYGCDGRINAGVLATLRFSLPSLRVTGDFHDADMLALSDIFIRHGNVALRYIQRLDFTIASKEGRLNGKRGFRSHGGMALAKILQASDEVQEVRLSRNKIGPYGATAIFLAASKHPSLTSLLMRRCRIMERGGLAFAEIICQSKECRLQHVDLSSNRIGLRGSIAIEQELSKRKLSDIAVDLEGNLVFQEVRLAIFFLTESNTPCLTIFLFLDYERNHAWTWIIVCLCRQRAVIESCQGPVHQARDELCRLLHVSHCTLHQFYSLSFLLFDAKHKVHL